MVQMRPFFSFFFLSATLLLFSSCQKRVLYMQVDNISRESLASYKIGTPDPRLIYPPVGQRMIVSWNLPPKDFVAEEMAIKLSIVYGDYSREEWWFTPRKSFGMYMRTLLNDCYFQKCGYLSYRSELFYRGKVIAEWRHRLWCEPITFSYDDDNEDDNEEDNEEENEEDSDE